MSRTWTVRQRLVTLVLAFMVPTVLAAVLAIWYVYAKERGGFERLLTEAARAMSLVVDRELARREAMLKALAESPALTTGDLGAFYDYARRVSPTAETAIVLSDVQGQQLLNTRRPLGSELPRTVFGRGERGDPLGTLVSDVYFAPVGQRHSFAVQVPVVREGRIVYYLSMSSDISQVQQVLAEQGLPDGWVATIIDRNGTIVARSQEPERFAGQRVPARQMDILERLQGTAFEVPSLDNRALVGSFSRTRVHGWGSFIGVTQSQVTSPARTAAAFGAAALLLIAGALWAALRVARRLVHPIVTLSVAAERMARGEVVAAARTGVRETDVVASAMAHASARIRATNTLMEQRVSAALDEAERAHHTMVKNQRLEAMGQLTGGVAHDFNNLLMVVNTNVHLLRARNPALAHDTQLARIDRAVATGSKLTRQLLAFARRQALRPEVMDLASTLPELMDLIRPTLSSRIAATCEVAPDADCIEADPAELELAVINLAVNAKDAMPDGGTLLLRARRAADDALGGRPAVLIELVDSGHGIAPDVLDKVFEPFFTTKEIGRGTGLGLSQVYGFATQAGGTAQVRSAPGAGTTVTLLLPRVGEHATPGRTTAETPPVVLPCDVLLVEDNPDLAQATRELLEQAGCTVHHAPDAQAAVHLLDTLPTPPDVVLSDIRMPGDLDGVGLAQWLRQHHPNLPVLLMTGYTGELATARAAGLDVLAKPSPPAQLLGAIGAARERARAAA